MTDMDDFSCACDQLDATLVAGSDREQTMRTCIDALWQKLAPFGVSWIGFYTKVPDVDEMVLGPSRDTPACSPIGMHGVCGKAYLEKRAVIVHDTNALGDAFIACDPRDRSELVIPLFDGLRCCWGVLDADSHSVGTFTHNHAVRLTTLMESIGLSVPGQAGSVLEL